MAYLMYRAKKDRASLCGGRTTGVYVSCDGERPEWIRPPDFARAEQESTKLDFLLSAAARFALLSDPGGNLETNAQGLGQMMVGLEGLRAVVFSGLDGHAISAAAETGEPTLDE
jgi:hypothetical protein